VAFAKSNNWLQESRMVRPLPRPPVVSRENSWREKANVTGEDHMLHVRQLPLTKSPDSNSAFVLMSPNGGNAMPFRLKMKKGCSSIAQALSQDMYEATLVLSNVMTDQELSYISEEDAFDSTACWKDVDEGLDVRTRTCGNSRPLTSGLRPNRVASFGECTPMLTPDTSFESLDSPWETTPCARREDPSSPPPLRRVTTNIELEPAYDEENLPCDLFFPTF